MTGRGKKQQQQNFCRHDTNLRLEYTMRFPPDLQSGEVDASCPKSEPVCRFELTDFIENRIVYDGHTLRFHLGPYDFRDAENADGIAESSHKNRIYSLTWNVMEFVKVWIN